VDIVGKRVWVSIGGLLEIGGKGVWKARMSDEDGD
jgi:hypothetical protein